MKHYEEWGLHIDVSHNPNSVAERLKKITIIKNSNILEEPAKTTVITIEKITPWADYTCVKLLAELLPNKEMKLSALLTHIAEWRKNLMVHPSTP